jgi:hypothetical protein
MWPGLSKPGAAPYRATAMITGRSDSAPLAGLILTDMDGGDAASMAATLSVAGQTLLEYQARVARSCGVRHIVVLVEAMPAALVAALDRLRDDGIDIEIARTPADAADRIHPDELAVVMANGAVATRALVERLARHEAPVILTVADEAGHVRLERIDAHRRWSGLALLPGAVLRKTSALIGDWTYGPTLLRVALQAGIRQEEAERIDLVLNAEDARAASLRLLEGEGDSAAVALDALVVAPLVSRLLPAIMARPVPFEAVAALPVLMLAASLALAGFGWLLTGVSVFLLSAFPAVTGRRMSHVAARPSRGLDLFERLRLPAFALHLAIAGWLSMAAEPGWGSMALAAWAAIALLLQPAVARSMWMADAGWGGLVLAVGLAAGRPVVALAAIVVHAVVTQFMLVRALR